MNQLKELKKDEQTNPKLSIRKEIAKITAELNDIDNKGTVQKFNETER